MLARVRIFTCPRPWPWQFHLRWASRPSRCRFPRVQNGIILPPGAAVSVKVDAHIQHSVHRACPSGSAPVSVCPFPTLCWVLLPSYPMGSPGQPCAYHQVASEGTGAQRWDVGSLSSMKHTRRLKELENIVNATFQGHPNGCFFRLSFPPLYAKKICNP